MQSVVIAEPYKFVAPYHGAFWTHAFQPVLPFYLRKAFGVESYEIRGSERLRRSIQQGNGILLCPNHCRPSDPMAMGLIHRAAGCHTYSMASWHVFKQSRLQRFLTRRFGAFSIYREGTDRQALNAAADIVVAGKRPLIVFPEGAISRCNDHMLTLMDGTSFIARTAAKRRMKQNVGGSVVIHPIALRYEFLGDIEQAVRPVLAEIEQRLTWEPQPDEPIYRRCRRIGRALLALKEIRYTGTVHEGDVYDRLEGLIDAILHPLETEWLSGPQVGTVVARVKSLRSAILPDMTTSGLDEAERTRRWQQLADVYLAQQLSLYPRDYVDENSPPERILETIERFEEDLTDTARVHGPLRLVMEIGEPIEVDAARPRGEADPVMTQLREQLESRITALGEEIRQKRAGR